MRDGEHINLKQNEARRMGIKSPWRKVKSRYYAASASHIVVSPARSHNAPELNLYSITISHSDSQSFIDIVNIQITRICPQSLINVLTYAQFSSKATIHGESGCKVECQDRFSLANLPATPTSGESTPTLATSKPLYISAGDTPYLSHLYIR